MKYPDFTANSIHKASQKKKKKKGTALPLPDWPQTPPHLRDELWRTETGEHVQCSDTSGHLLRAAAHVWSNKKGERRRRV